MEAVEYSATFREYVGAIYELGEEGLPVIQARIAHWLGVSRASVSEMVGRMETEGLVTSEGQVVLTVRGRHLAEVVVRRHRLAERFLVEILGLPWVKVHAEAEIWEQIISDDVEQAMINKLGRPHTCPHGNPIPGAGYRQPELRPLAELENDTMVLHRISEELELDPQIMGFLDESGLRPGAEVDLVERSSDGSLSVRVNRSGRIGVESFIANRLFVSPQPL
jgi:DtxR family Mn-dependent transcriptional regulator